MTGAASGQVVSWPVWGFCELRSRYEYLKSMCCRGVELLAWDHTARVSQLQGPWAGCLICKMKAKMKYLPHGTIILHKSSCDWLILSGLAQPPGAGWACLAMPALGTTPAPPCLLPLCAVKPWSQSFHGLLESLLPIVVSICVRKGGSCCSCRAPQPLPSPKFLGSSCTAPTPGLQVSLF